MRHKSMTLPVLAMAILFAVASTGPGTAEEPELTYSGSLQVASGKYTLSETTTSFLLFNGLSCRRGRWNLSASIPLINQDSPFVTYAGGTPVPSGRRQGVGDPDPSGGSGSGGAGGSGRGPGGTVEVPDPNTLDFNENGVGDPLLRADFALSEGVSSGVRFGVYGAVKPPLADEDSGFGTGEWDYGAGITVSKKAGSTLLLADVGAWIFGDLPDLELKDPLAYSLAVGRTLAGGRTSVLGSVSGLTETFAGVDGPIQVGVTASRILRQNRSLSVTLAAGLTDSAPDYLLSAGWRVGL